MNVERSNTFNVPASNFAFAAAIASAVPAAATDSFNSVSLTAPEAIPPHQSVGIAVPPLTASMMSLKYTDQSIFEPTKYVVGQSAFVLRLYVTSGVHVS